MSVSLRPRSLGELINLCFSLAASHFGQLFVIVAILGIPSLLVQFLMVPLQKAAESGPVDPEQALAAVGGAFLLLLLLLILQPIQQVASILVVAGSFTGDRRTLGECFSLALNKFVPIFLFTMIVGLIMAIGLLLLLVPCIIFFTWYYLGAVALVVENLSWREAMGRSKQLSEGFRWNILLYVAVLVILFIVGNMTCSFLVALIIEPGYLLTTVKFLISVVFNMVACVAPVVYYFNVRLKKEAFDVEALSSLVDAIAAREAASDAPEV